MIINHFSLIASLTNDCPKCGSDKLGANAGKLIVDENIYMRSCKCGFRFEYDADNGVTRNKIKKAIQEALRDDKIRFCIESEKEFEGYHFTDFHLMNDDELNDKVSFFDYLWTK